MARSPLPRDEVAAYSRGVDHSLVYPLAEVFMVWLLLVLRWAHVLSAIALMGGAIFARFAVVPTLAELPADQRYKLHEKLRQRWAKFVHLAVALLLVTGLINLGLASRYNFSGLDGFFSNKTYNIIAGVKFLLALPILGIASILVGRSALAEKLRENGKFWLSVNLLLAVIVVLIGGLLKFADRQPKETAPANATAETRF